MVDVVLVRHASTTWSGLRYCGRSDPRLSAAGRIEASSLADRLAPTLQADARIITSPARRAVATADAIARAAGGRAIERDQRWSEADFGLAEGRTFAELASIAPATAAAILAGEAAVDWPDGETAASLAARIGEACADLAVDGRPAVVVTHAGPIVHAVALSTHGLTRTADLVPTATFVRISIPAKLVQGRHVLPSRA
jgi:broad specificity phosphatase PhoE